MDEASFRAAMGGFATGVCVIASRDGAGEPVGFTASSLASVSLDPPLVLFCLGRDSEAAEAFAAAGSFAVSVLAADQQAVSADFSLDPRRGFAVWDWSPGETGAPLITGRAAGLECALERIEEGGDHRIFICRALRGDADETRAPLIHFRGGYRGLA